MLWKRIRTTVWNGPFHVGSLTSPVAAGDAILKVLETLWRVMLLILAAILLIGATANVQETLWDGLFPTLSTKVDSVASYDAGRCGKDYPILIGFTNQSRDMLGSVDFHLTVRDNGSSDLNVGVPTWTYYGLVRPGATTWECFAVPQLKIGFAPKTLLYSAEVSNVTPFTGDPNVVQVRLPPSPSTAPRKAAGNNCT